MMDTRLDLFMYGVVFTVDLLLVGMMGAGVVRNVFLSWNRGVVWWVAWWAAANAMTIVVSVLAGEEHPLSYMSVGTITESMINVGLLAWVVSHYTTHWNDSQPAQPVGGRDDE